MKINVVSGDITQTPCDAIITAINSGKMWFGGIDGAIRRAAGSLFHDQAAKIRSLCEGLVIVAKGEGIRHSGKFKNVVFVVDDLESPLSSVIFNGLTSAAAAGFSSVCLPTIRMGVMLGAVEKSNEEAVGEMAGGIRRFLEKNPESPIESITFVVYHDSDIEALLKRTLDSMPSIRQ